MTEIQNTSNIPELNSPFELLLSDKNRDLINAVV